MAARSKARKRALDILFEAEMRNESPFSVLDSRMIQADPPVTSYAAELVRGVQAHRDQIDELLAENAHGWTLERMPAVDRNVLRIGAYELLWGAGVPSGVAISEAVLLAQDLSTDGSPAFVNGLLARLLEIKPNVVGEAAEASAGAGAGAGASPGGGAVPAADDADDEFEDDDETGSN
ncbi:MAG TPA: transcription antitermination factor NusB [Streptosporangiaceae bacterium]|nr:transcription antitermination factor NusB [Streptosporangiaceae bacterium]